MKSYKVKIRFITDYLQARFSENAKEELENYISKGIVKSEEDSWKVLLYEDDNGVYIPSLQIRGALINSGKEFKIKKQRRSMKLWVISNVIIEPGNIYLKKKEPDSVLVSHPQKKDGNKITVKHPVINKNTEIEFVLKSIDNKMEDKAIKNLIITAGSMYGIGARRRDMFGRFELIKFKKQ